MNGQKPITYAETAAAMAAVSVALERAGGSVREALDRPGRYWDAPDHAEAIKELCRAWLREELKKRPIIRSSENVCDYVAAKIGHRETEAFMVLYLNPSNAILADEIAFTGTVDSAAVWPREIIKRALELNAAALVLAHNHPSGDTTPSFADKSITRQVQLAAEIMGIKTLDHVIVGPGPGHHSMRSSGLLDLSPADGIKVVLGI